MALRQGPLAHRQGLPDLFLGPRVVPFEVVQVCERDESESTDRILLAEYFPVNGEALKNQRLRFPVLPLRLQGIPETDQAFAQLHALASRQSAILQDRLSGQWFRFIVAALVCRARRGIVR